MKYCTKCGNLMRDYELFCKKCVVKMIFRSPLAFFSILFVVITFYTFIFTPKQLTQKPLTPEHSNSVGNNQYEKDNMDDIYNVVENDTFSTSLSKDNHEKSDESSEVVQALNNENLYNDVKVRFTEIGLDETKIKKFKYDREWLQGDVYTFTYESNQIELYTIGEDRVKSINKGDVKVYDEGYESLNINDYLIGTNMCDNLYFWAKDTLKRYLTYSSEAKFPLYDGWGYGKSNDIYMVSGTVEAKNYFGVDSTHTFYLEYTADGLCLYGVLNGTIIIGEASKVTKIDREPVENTETEELGETIILREGKLGQYGKDDGDNIFYYIPSGYYEVTSLTNRAQMWIFQGEKRINYEGKEEDVILEKIRFTKMDEKTKVMIPPESRVLLIVSSEISLQEISELNYRNYFSSTNDTIQLTEGRIGIYGKRDDIGSHYHYLPAGKYNVTSEGDNATFILYDSNDGVSQRITLHNSKNSQTITIGENEYVYLLSKDVFNFKKINE